MVQAVGGRQLDYINDLLGDPECGPKAWRKLLDVHSPTHATGIVLLARRLRDIKFVDGEPMQPVLDEMRDIFTKLQGGVVVYLKLVQCVEIMIRLPESWSALAINLNSQQPLWSVDYIRARILEEDLRRRRVERSEEGAGYGVGGGKSGFKKKWKGKNKDFPKEDGGGGQGEVCFYCKKRGHRWRKCYQRPKDWTPPSSSNLHGGKRSGGVMGASGEEKDEEKGGKSEERKAGRVCKLKKAIYGLKQAPRCWYEKLEEVLLGGGFKTSQADHSLFLLGEGEQLLLLLVYVHDILLFSPSMEQIERTQKLLMDNFKCKMLGDVHYYLGLQIERDVERRWLKVYQSHYISGVMEHYGVTGGRTVMTPFLAGFELKKAAEEDDVLEDEQRNEYQSLIGSVMYATVHTRPDASFGVGQLARVVQWPTEEQLEVAKRLVRYLGSTASAGVQFSAGGQLKQIGGDGVMPGTLKLSCFTDATWASEDEDQSSVGGFVCMVGGGPVSWRSKK
ncbi:unnamed protein product [Closterium sp. NIES-54]